jgi:hypothetical protein
MSIFQKAYDLIKAIKTPAWLKALLGELQTIMFNILKNAGKEYLSQLEVLIVEAYNKPNWTNQQKFKYVFDNARNSGIQALVELKDAELNALIENLYLRFKVSIG